MLNINVKNEKLYDALLSLTKVILKIVSEKMSQNLISARIENSLLKQDNSYLKYQIHTFEWGFFFHIAKDEIVKTKEFSYFVKIAEEDKIILPQLNTLVGSCEGLFRFEGFDFALKPVFEFLTNEKILDFDIDKFNVIYSKIETDLYADTIEYERITPLCGFIMDDIEIKLTENISIVKLSEQEILEFFRLGINLGHGMGNQAFIFDIQQYAIKVSYNHPKIIGDNISIGENERNKYFDNNIEKTIIDALRIYKEGSLYSISTLKKGKSIFSMGVVFSRENPVKPYINKFKLLKEEVDEFKSFWKIKTENNLPSFLSVGIRRFSQSNERDSVEDKIIDFMIAAEAIFLSSGGSFQGELKYRLSHRASMFIEDDVTQQRYIFIFMQKAYDVRSSIVHGSKPKLPKKIDDSDYTLEEFCGDIERYLRISIKKAILLTHTTKKLNPIDWDSIIFPSPNSAAEAI